MTVLVESKNAKVSSAWIESRKEFILEMYPGTHKGPPSHHRFSKSEGAWSLILTFGYARLSPQLAPQREEGELRCPS